MRRRGKCVHKGRSARCRCAASTTAPLHRKGPVRKPDAPPTQACRQGSYRAINVTRRAKLPVRWGGCALLCRLHVPRRLHAACRTAARSLLQLRTSTPPPLPLAEGCTPRAQMRALPHRRRTLTLTLLLLLLCRAAVHEAATCCRCQNAAGCALKGDTRGSCSKPRAGCCSHRRPRGMLPRDMDATDLRRRI